MRLPRQQRQHPRRVGLIEGFPERLAANDDSRIGAQNGSVAVMRRDRHRFCLSEPGDGIFGPLACVKTLVDPHGRHVEGDARRAQQLRPAGRC